MFIEDIDLKPIGIIKTTTMGKKVRKKDAISKIVLRNDLTESLTGIDEFSHLFIIFWMHEISVEERRTVKTYPRGRIDLPLLGVFATRTPHRPNPIGMTLVELLKVDRNVLTVRNLDAFDGTPVLDIKPFENWDMTDDAQVPPWWKNLEMERTN